MLAFAGTLVDPQYYLVWMLTDANGLWGRRAGQVLGYGASGSYISKRRSLATARIALWGSFSAILTHGISSHLNAMGVVHQAVEDANGQRGIADLFVPSRDW